LSDFDETWNFSPHIFEKNIYILNFTKIRPLGAEMSHADGVRLTHDEANNRFSQISERAH
jgi:hypothetical protein